MENGSADRALALQIRAVKHRFSEPKQNDAQVWWMLFTTELRSQKTEALIANQLPLLAYSVSLGFSERPHLNKVEDTNFLPSVLEYM